MPSPKDVRLSDRSSLFKTLKSILLAQTPAIVELSFNEYTGTAICAVLIPEAAAVLSAFPK